MNRKLALVLLVWAASAHAADFAKLSNDALIPMAQRPIEIQDSSGRLLEKPNVHEYVRFASWNYSEGPQAEVLDVVAIVENLSEEKAQAVNVTLQVNRRVTSLSDGIAPEPSGDWTGWQDVQSKNVESLGSRTAEKVVFENMAIKGLWFDLWQAKQWPSQVRFRVRMTCGNCAAEVIGKEATIRFVAAD